MSELVIWLRERQYPLNELCEQAADEIEKLHGILSEAQNPHSRECAQNKEWTRGVCPPCDCAYGRILYHREAP